MKWLLPLNKEVISKNGSFDQFVFSLASMRGCNPLTSSPAIKLGLPFSEKDYVEKNLSSPPPPHLRHLGLAQHLQA